MAAWWDGSPPPGVPSPLPGVSTLFLALPRVDTVVTLGLLVVSLFCVLRAPVVGVFLTAGSTIIIDTFSSPHVQTFLSDMGFSPT